MYLLLYIVVGYAVLFIYYTSRYVHIIIKQHIMCSNINLEATCILGLQ